MPPMSPIVFISGRLMGDTKTLQDTNTSYGILGTSYAHVKLTGRRPLYLEKYGGGC